MSDEVRKENDKAAAEAEKEVAAWKAIVGEKTRREEAAKAEAERIATEKAEAERKAAEERERVEKEEKGRQRRSVKPKRRKEKLKLMGMGRMDSTSSLGQ